MTKTHDSPNRNNDTSHLYAALIAYVWIICIEAYAPAYVQDAKRHSLKQLSQIYSVSSQIELEKEKGDAYLYCQRPRRPKQRNSLSSLWY